MHRVPGQRGFGGLGGFLRVAGRQRYSQQRQGAEEQTHGNQQLSASIDLRQLLLARTVGYGKLAIT